MVYDTHERLLPERRRRGVTWEFRTYFVAILLLIALPIAILQRAADAFRPRGAKPHPGVVHRALREAHIITTTIFSA